VEWSHLLIRILHDIAHRCYGTTLAHAMDTGKSLILDRRVPMRLHNIGATAGGQIESRKILMAQLCSCLHSVILPVSTTRSSEENDFHCRIMTKRVKGENSVLGRYFAIEANAWDRRLIQGPLDYVKSRSPE
jgi:hypothetical protein